MSSTEPLEIDEELAAAQNALAEQQGINAAKDREIALLRALGGDAMESALGKMFASAYSGDLDSEKIRLAAAEVGLGVTEAPLSTAPTKEELAQQATREGMVQNAGAPLSAEAMEAALHPAESGLNEFRKAQAGGETRQRAAAQFVDRQIAAAIKGDERAMWKGWAAKGYANEDLG